MLVTMLPNFINDWKEDVRVAPEEHIGKFRSKRDQGISRVSSG